MSNKKKKNQPQKKSKRPVILLSAIIALVAVGIGVLTWYLVNKEPPQIVQYNGALTAKAQDAGYIGVNEVLIVHTVDDSAPGYTRLECYIYQVPQGVKTKKMLKYYAHELPEKWDLEPVGEGSARFLKGDLSSLYSFNVYHTK
jgi:flagellar basal body-associated protein FliL